MAEKIEIPGVGNYPLWATEDSLKDLIKMIAGSDLLKKKSGGSSSGGTGAGKDSTTATKMFIDALGEASDQTKGVTKNFGSLYDALGNKKITSNITPFATWMSNTVKDGLSYGKTLSSLSTSSGKLGSTLMDVAPRLGNLAPIAMAAGMALQGLEKILGEYNAILGDAIDAGLGYSDNLGKAATIAGESGLSLQHFYEAVKEAGQGMRALGGNGEEAAQNFAKMQTEVRNTYGTFGMSNVEMAKSSGMFVKLVGAAGLKGADAAQAAAESQGKSMNEMRKISIATGISLGKVMGSFKDLVGSPLISLSLSKFGDNVADAAMRLARGSASFESVFGDLGKQLYKEMAQAQAAGLSIINTKLGAEIAPFVDVRTFEQFQKAAQDGGAASVQAAQQFQKSIEPNLSTLKLLAATGDKTAEQMLTMYESSKKFTSMSEDEIQALDDKKRAEEKFKTIQEKMSAAFESLYNKVFKFIDIIPIELVEGLGDAFELVTDALGGAIDIIVGVLKITLFPVLKALGIVFGGVVKIASVVVDKFKETVTWVTEVTTGISDFISSILDGAKTLFDPVVDFLVEGAQVVVNTIVDAMLWLPKKLWEGIKSVGGWVAKLFGVGGGESSASADTSGGTDAMGNLVLGSQVDNSGQTAQDAVVQTQANLQADAAKATQQTSDDLKRLVDINADNNAHLVAVASNTGQTKEAVERNGATY